MNPPPSNPPNPPSSTQFTDGYVGNVSAQATIAYTNTFAAPYCQITLGNGTPVASGSGVAGRIDYARYQNGSTPTVSLLSSATTPTLGINRLTNGYGMTVSSCVFNTFQSGDKVQFRGNASATTPVVFGVTATTTASGASANPLWVEAY